MSNQKKNLWVLSEERPKKEVTVAILMKFADDKNFSYFIDPIRVLPVLENEKFAFVYEVFGFQCNKIDKIYVRCASGYSSFVDFLLFYQNDEPVQSDIPTHAIEETKTSDSESRNTAVYQRATKFVYIDKYYDSVKKVMLYNDAMVNSKEPSPTYKFGAKLLSTIGVEMMGVKEKTPSFVAFKSVDEIIDFKNNQVSRGRKGNHRILITKHKSKITLTGKLYKSGRLAHDPNIGALSLISAAIRKLGFVGEIIIEKHGLNQSHARIENKFIRVAKLLGLKIDGLHLPCDSYDKEYWAYEVNGEKLATIFIHLVVENFTQGYSIFENHAGCEKSYFVTRKNKRIQLEKYYDREKYKAGDRSQIISIPDIILVDIDREQVINVEGKIHKKYRDGIKDLKEFYKIEEKYIKPHYANYAIIRTIVLYGGNETSHACIEVGFLLNCKGDLVLGIKAPKLFKEAIKNLLDYWQC